MTEQMAPVQDDPQPASLRVEGLSKTFSSRGQTINALQDIHLTVKPNEFFVIVGPSGCGKSTFLRIVQGLEQPSAGLIELDGKPLHGASTDRGFVFQQDSLYPWRSVLKNVTFGLELKGARREVMDARARDFVRLVGLAGFENHYPNELSGGMRQRVNLARALAVDPQMLLMDEPFAALDAMTRETMQKELLRIAASAKKTVLFITHQIDEAVFLADRVAIFSARPGRLVDIVDIDLPRPRDLQIKRTREFQAYVDRIWNSVFAEEHETA